MFLTILLSAFTFKPPSGPSANGQGSQSLPGDISRRFSFHANTMPDGSVKGSGVLTYTGGVLKIMFDIDCLRVVGKTATMSGTVTKFDGDIFTNYVPGTKIYFKVTDNGEGGNANPDQLSRLSSFAGGCNVPLAIAESPIDGGNIQVKP